MAAGSSSDGGLIAVVDDFYFSVLAHGRNDDDTVEDELFPISDKKRNQIVKEILGRSLSRG